MSRPDNLLERVPPHSLEAEQATLGAMMLEKEAIAKVVALGLEARHFYRDLHGFLFQAIADLYNWDEPADSVSIAEALQRKQQLEQVGGRPYLLVLLNAAPSAQAVLHYAKIVQEKAVLRGLLVVASQVQDNVYRAGDQPVTDIVLASQAALAKASEIQPVSIVEYSLMDIMVGEDEPVDWIIKPFSAKGTVSMIHGREGIAKSIIALDMAICVAYGKNFMGLEKWEPFLRGPVVYWDSDNPERVIKKRARYIGAAHSLNGASGPNLWFPKNFDLDITDPACYRAIRDYLVSKQAVLFVVDIFSDSHNSPNENDSALMRPVMKAFRNLAKELNISILLIHHDRKGQQSQAGFAPAADNPGDSGRGSTTIFGKLDERFSLRMVQNCLILNHTKNRLSSKGETLEPFEIEIEGDSEKKEPVRVLYGSPVTKTLTTMGQIENDILRTLEACDWGELSGKELYGKLCGELKHNRRSYYAMLNKLVGQEKVNKRPDPENPKWGFYSLLVEE